MQKKPKYLFVLASSTKRYPLVEGSNLVGRKDPQHPEKQIEVSLEVN
mgnify:CR=1 FL=1|jgi:hypothetical protein